MGRVRRYANARAKRHARVRAKVSGTVERPRLCVFRSLNHIYAQVIDDTQGHTLVAASTSDPLLRDQLVGKNKVESASVVGELVGKRTLERGIRKVVFDRGGYKYHGRVKAVAEGARSGGLEF